MVLEDLTPSMRTLENQHNLTEPQENGSILYERWVDKLVSLRLLVPFQVTPYFPECLLWISMNQLTGMFYTLHQIHACGIRTGLGSIYPIDIFVLRNFPTSQPGPEQIVFVGFATSVPLEEWSGPDGTLTAREWDCGAVIGNLYDMLIDGIAFKWQDFMHSGRRTVLGDPEILFENTANTDYFPRQNREFEDIGTASGCDEFESGLSKEGRTVERNRRGVAGLLEQ